MWPASVEFGWAKPARFARPLIRRPCGATPSPARGEGGLAPLADRLANRIETSHRHITEGRYLVPKSRRDRRRTQGKRGGGAGTA
jgi:hypothetical protein